MDARNFRQDFHPVKLLALTECANSSFSAHQPSTPILQLILEFSLGLSACLVSTMALPAEVLAKYPSLRKVGDDDYVEVVTAPTLQGSTTVDTDGL